MKAANDNGAAELRELFLGHKRSYDRGFMRFLYLMQCEHFLKIGVAKDVESRRCDLQSPNPFPVKVLLYRQVPSVFAFVAEKRIHAMLAEHKHRNEWFTSDLPATRLAFITVARAAQRAGQSLDAELREERRRSAA